MDCPLDEYTDAKDVSMAQFLQRRYEEEESFQNKDHAVEIFVYGANGKSSETENETATQIEMFDLINGG